MKRKMLPWFTASIAVCWSALPVSIILTLSGESWLTHLRNSIPSIPGIRMSVITTA
jgi:hypothetical protein